MHLIFDTETSGFPSTNYTFNHPKQARIMQIAAILLDDKFEEQGIFHSLVKIPEHVEVSESALAIHKINKEHCREYGVPIELAMIYLDAFLSVSQYQVAHNIDFDLKMIHLEEASIYGASRFKTKNRICTMNLMTDICKIPSQRGGYKWPKLEEAYSHLFKDNNPTFHNSLSDVRACARIYKWLWDNGFIEEKIINLESTNPQE